MYSASVGDHRVPTMNSPRARSTQPTPVCRCSYVDRADEPVSSNHHSTVQINPRNTLRSCAVPTIPSILVRQRCDIKRTRTLQHECFMHHKRDAQCSPPCVCLISICPLLAQTAILLYRTCLSPFLAQTTDDECGRSSAEALPYICNSVCANCFSLRQIKELLLASGVAECDWSVSNLHQTIL